MTRVRCLDVILSCALRDDMDFSIDIMKVNLSCGNSTIPTSAYLCSTFMYS